MINKDLTDDEALALMNAMNFNPNEEPEPEPVKMGSSLIPPFQCMSCGRLFSSQDVLEKTRRTKYLTKNCPYCKSELVVRAKERGGDISEKYDSDVKDRIYGPSEWTPRYGRKR